MTKANTVEPVITMAVEIVTTLPKPDPQLALFFVDNDGNPTTKQQRQQGLQFSVAGGENKGANAA